MEEYMAAARNATTVNGSIPEPDGAIRFFEQSGRTRQQLPDETAFQKSIDAFDTSELKGALEDMKSTIKGEDEKKAFSEVMGQLEKVLGQIEGGKDLERFSEQMDTFSKSIDRDIEEATADLPQDMLKTIDFGLPELSEDLPLPIQGMKSSSPQVVEGPWTLNQRRKIFRLNNAISGVYKRMQEVPGPTRKGIVAIYKTYHAARLTLAHSWSHVPLEVWDFLWKVFSVDESVNVHRLAHISMLARDMTEAKVPLSPPQQLLAIEAMFMEGWEDRAVDSWKRCISTLGQERAETYKDFWELGVRMHCRSGSLEQARRAARKLIDKRMDARILLPLIGSLSEQNTEESHREAWDTYRQMRDLLGKSMKLTDYDKVVACFLTTGQTENALYAFVDMMSDGQIDLTVQKYMPSVVANKFFVGKWLKRLIGAGDMDGAHSVVEFMRTKGVEASPIQINGLIGAWQRSGGARDLERSEQVAWEMIQNRIDFVRARKSASAKDLKKTAVAAAAVRAPLPRATLETFCILAENYRLRERHERLAALWDASRDAEICPDAFMMNQLLEAHIQAGQHREALALYGQLVVEDRGVRPDPYTFSALWKTLAVNRLHVVPPEMADEAVAALRRLFAETVAQRAVFGGNDGATTMDGQLARKILHTFRRARDPAGFVVALAALRDVFSFAAPAEALVLELVLGTTRLAWDAPAPRRKLLQAKRELDRELLAAGGAGDEDGEGRGRALAAHLERLGLEQLGGTEAAREPLAAAARDMGVDELLRPGAVAGGWA
ncbi:pentatricopeptide repeat protein [Cordyceps fumosorosea ARSEF 2679]|uniref:Pentatricopeptide repeat protein n=1 Tax=Cordyceps fumosorosea (strain ARSEF 2679) TaxID=1081104 RepID=A0A168DZT8_CORFA|nr:pentatricopeptide repeat protein [Cordyceps fumosorosea ARSEF 2679]OAA73201.1 pentatricopeptide repeat protein [Cordyceps fumosorosea ARSEF 2679]